MERRRQRTLRFPWQTTCSPARGVVSRQTGRSRYYEKQADQYTPNDPYFHWMLGLSLQNVGMNRLAEKHFARAIELDHRFILRRRVNPGK